MEIISIPKNENNKLYCEAFILIVPADPKWKKGVKCHVCSPNIVVEAEIKAVSTAKIESMDDWLGAITFGKGENWRGYLRRCYLNADNIEFDLLLMQKL